MSMTDPAGPSSFPADAASSTPAEPVADASYADASYIERDVASFPVIAHSVNQLAATLPLADMRIDDFFLFGSFLRSPMTREPVKDIDIAFTQARDIRTMQRFAARCQVAVFDPTGGGNVIKPFDVSTRHIASPAAFFRYTDFSCTRLLYHHRTRTLHVHTGFLDSVLQWRMAVNHEPLTQPLKSIGRSFKYVTRGYQLDLDAVDRMLEEYEQRGWWKYINAHFLYLITWGRHLPSFRPS